MRYHGGGIGHRAHGVDAETSRQHGLRVRRAGQHTARARTINQAINSLFTLDSDSDSDSESGLDEPAAHAPEDHATAEDSTPAHGRSSDQAPITPLEDESSPDPDLILLDAIEGQAHVNVEAAWEQENHDEDRPGRDLDAKDLDSEDSDDDDGPPEIEDSAPLLEGEDDYEEDRDSVYASVGYASL